MWRYGLIAVFVVLPLQAVAQTDDRAYLTAFLEDGLSGAGRKVVVTGFAGALSSQATVQELTIADDQGIWLTLRDVTLDWSRTDLFSGQVTVNQLTAGEIILDRLPAVDTAAPSAEAGSFALPELPVSVQIDKVAAERIVLGAPILGTMIEGRIDASLSLAGGEGQGNLLIERTDSGPAGKLELKAGYSNTAKLLTIDLQATEEAGGVAATLLGLPGLPSAALIVQGTGPISDFAADIALSTDAVDRLVGKAQLTGQADGATAFSADLAGDLAPLFLPAYAKFFGNSVALKVKGQRWPDGRLDLATLDVAAKSLRLNGALMLAADGLPERFNLTGQIAAPDGSAVLLPLTTEMPVKINRADISLGYDSTKGQGWTADVALTGLDRPDFRASRLSLNGSGKIAREAGMQQFDGAFRFAAEGLEPTSAALARALGSVVWGDAELSWSEGEGAVSLPKLNLAGEDYSVSLSGRMSGLEDALQMIGQAEAQIGDLSRLSGLVGRPLSGAAQVKVAGTGSPLTGAFDLEIGADGQDMGAGIAALDNLLKGEAQFQASVVRDTTGTILRSSTITAASLTADAAGRLASTGSDIAANLNFTDLRSLGRGYRGTLTGAAQFTGTPEDGRISLNATGLGLGIGQPPADKLLAGESQMRLELTVKDGEVQVERADLANPQLDAQATGVLAGGQQTVNLTARLRNLALLVPEFPGVLTVKGQAVRDAGGITIDLTGQGPGQINAAVKGKIATGMDTANLAITGTAQAALGNAFTSPRAISGRLGFDLRLNGPLAFASVSGPVTLVEGRLADPGLNFAFQNITASAKLAGGRATISVDTEVSSGGQLTAQGSASLRAPYAGDIAIVVSNVTLRDPDLYESTLNGNLTLSGPLRGGATIAGRIVLQQTELRVPSTGFGGAGGLPGLRHVNEQPAVRATRDRAGLIAKAGGTTISGDAFALDITVSAPNRVFIRGRGLDAELGGELRLLGTTANVQPAGSFELIRGRLEILGKRLNLTEALLQLQGELVPFLRIVATTENDGITSGVLIEGPATAPNVTFTSSPQLPEEEVLAQLLFGQSLLNLSALQALQLANAVATLAGQGGEGIVSRLRKGFGLDNLDVKTDAAGGVSLTAGKYISENVYSEVTVDQDGKSQINLNLDVTKSITLRGRASSDGSTGLGIVLEKDY